MGSRVKNMFKNRFNYFDLLWLVVVFVQICSGHIIAALITMLACIFISAALGYA